MITETLIGVKQVLLAYLREIYMNVGENFRRELAWKQTYLFATLQFAGGVECYVSPVFRLGESEFIFGWCLFYTFLYFLDKFLNSSIMSETDMDSDEETLFENHKPYKPGRTSQMNGVINGAKKKNHHT